MTVQDDNKEQNGIPQWETPDFDAADDPLDLFAAWMGDARAAEPSDPNAMALATVDDRGQPNVRMVLLKDFGPGGFVFYTNFESAKGRELLANARAAMCFHWKSLRRQVRVRGPVERVTDEEADAYFASRARTSRIGAWASAQSRPLESRFAFEKRMARFTARFGVGTIPRPAYWSGFRLSAVEIEFWHERAFRLHDRLVFRRSRAAEPWRKTRLYP